VNEYLQVLMFACGGYLALIISDLVRINIRKSSKGWSYRYLFDSSKPLYTRLLKLGAYILFYAVLVLAVFHYKRLR
jgi:hypothetical protein